MSLLVLIKKNTFHPIARDFYYQIKKNTLESRALLPCGPSPLCPVVEVSWLTLGWFLYPLRMWLHLGVLATQIYCGTQKGHPGPVSAFPLRPNEVVSILLSRSLSKPWLKLLPKSFLSSPVHKNQSALKIQRKLLSLSYKQVLQLASYWLWPWAGYFSSAKPQPLTYKMGYERPLFQHSVKFFKVIIWLDIIRPK